MEKAPIETSTQEAAEAFPPRPVAIAVRLAIAGLLFGVAMQLITIFGGGDTQSKVPGLITAVITIALMFWLYVCLYDGKNWARYVVLVLSALGWLMFLIPGFRIQIANSPLIAKISIFINTAANLYLLWAIFISSGRVWFNKLSVDHVA